MNVAIYMRSPDHEDEYRRQCLAAIDAGLAESSYLRLLMPWDVENYEARLRGDAEARRDWNHFCFTGVRSWLLRKAAL